MKKLIATLVLGLAISTAPVTASAQYRSYYDMMSSWNITLQQSFATRMIATYERSNKMYKNFIDRYSRYSSASWYQNMVTRHAWQVAEIAKYQAVVNKTGAPTLVDTIVTEVPGNVVQRRATVEASRDTSVVQERSETMVREFAVTTVVYNTPVRTINYINTKTVKVYSDGTRASSNDVKVTSVDEVVETETNVERELIREYAIVIESNTPSTAVAGMEILTEDEYLARDDVDYSQTDVYFTAVKNMNSRINDSYINDRMSTTFGNNLDTIGAPAAWSRGYTGAGSTIAIFDTGIDTDHSEFAGRIAATECFTAMCKAGLETIEDGNRYSHGTHVAGIAAAAFDGNGTTGVAPDAQLLIGKTAYNFGYFDFTQVDEAIAWAVDNGADVMNISANMNVDTTYKNSLRQSDDGSFYSIDTRSTYATQGYNNQYETANYYKNMVEAMKGHESVLVLAAGNQGMDIAGQPSLIAVDEEVGERVLVVGNYDVRYNDLNRGSNAAGTVCLAHNTDGTCTNDRRVSDRFIMAPGMYIAAPDANGSYRVNSGTSMAAPSVAGAVAVVRQMWPHMTGANLSSLLLNTASTDGIANYNVERHGQGLLDLDEATKPQGAVGLPTTGRADGGTVSVQGGVIAMSGASSISALEEVMVLDDYDRDFYFDATDMVQVADTRNVSVVRAAQQGVQPDNYIGYTGGAVIPTQHVAFAINDKTGSTAMAFSKDGFTIGVQDEKGSFLGNVADSELMRVTGAQTTYVGYQFDTGVLFGNAQLGATSLDVDQSTLMKSASTLMSYSASIGAKHSVGKTTFGATVALPVTVASGSANFTTPSSVSSSGTLEYANTTSSLATQRQEIDYGLFVNSALTDTSSIEAFAELRTNYASTADNAVEFGVNYKVRF